ncbi:MAG: toll/interleukin-1 receptor domain-containing protein [Hyphomonadaceae bacterium]
MADVFVSYAHANLDRVKPICDGLAQSGLSLWWDDHLKAGDDFALRIESELDTAGCVVVVWSEAARNSLWVRAEATEALDGNKLAQVRVDGVKPPLPFTVVEMLDLRRWRGSRGDAPWPQLEARARALAGGKAPGADERAFRGPALQDFGGSALLGWMSLGLIILIGALTLQLEPGGGAIRAGDYQTLALISFALACVAFVLTLLRVIRTALASSVKP